MSPFRRSVAVVLGVLLCVSSAGAASTAGSGGRPLTHEEAFCYAIGLIYAYNQTLDREQGIGYEDSLQVRDEVVAKKPMIALTALPGQGDAAELSVPVGSRVVVAERVPFENPEFYRVAVPQQGLEGVFMATGQFSQFATLENQIKHRDRVAALRDAFIGRIEREVLAPLGVTYEMLYRMFGQSRTTKC